MQEGYGEAGHALPTANGTKALPPPSLDRPRCPDRLGEGIHEMGTARMSATPETGCVDVNNRVHEIPNLYVTDGAFMTSAGCQNPSLTYMAFTARAVDHAVQAVNSGDLRV